eukprot:UN06284
MDNIPVYFGNPASEHAENHMNMAGIGRVLVVSPYRQLNPLVSFIFKMYLAKKKYLVSIMVKHRVQGISYLSHI